MIDENKVYEIHQLSFNDLISGIQSIVNTDNFPLESNPPQGDVFVRFSSGKLVRMTASVVDYRRALKMGNQEWFKVRSPEVQR